MTEPVGGADRSELALVVVPTPGAIGPAEYAALVRRTRQELELVDAELAEINMLGTQALTEATRHEQKRAAAATKLADRGKSGAPPADLVDASAQLVTLTRRAGLMQAQVDVLDGKSKTLTRYRDGIAKLLADLEGVGGPEPATADDDTEGAEGGPESDGLTPDTMGPGVSRMVLAAQEDLRREIARTMHDGPAQSLSNIALEAQIVERLLSRGDTALAKGEVRQLLSMVQQTLEATKSFIFDVRPMVLDDLGLVPTIRRACRERGRRAQIPVDCESFGPDRRLPMDLESGLFRILDEALAAFLASRPDRVAVRLEWGDGLEARVVAVREAVKLAAATGAQPAPSGRKGPRKGDVDTAEPLPPALAAMIEDRRVADSAAVRLGTGMPVATWRDIEQRATTMGIRAELSEDGRELRLAVGPGDR